MFFLASASVRPPLGDPAAVKKHAFAPKRFRKRGYVLRNPVKKMKQEKNTVQFSEIRSKGCNDIEMLERFLHGIVETATSKLRQRKLKTTEISIRLVHAKSENRLPLEFTFSIKPTSSSVIIYTEVINRFKECYTGGGIQGFTIQFDKNTLASA